jgi:hypothetical protein
MEWRTKNMYVDLFYVSGFVVLFFYGASGQGPPHYRGFMITLSRTPLDVWSARCRDLYMIKHCTHTGQTSKPQAGFKPTIRNFHDPKERPNKYFQAFCFQLLRDKTHTQTYTHTHTHTHHASELKKLRNRCCLVVRVLCYRSWMWNYWYDIIWYIFNRSWVDTRWQHYITHLHTNNIHNTEKGTLGSAGRAPSLRVIPWHLPYNWGKSTEKPQLG